MDKYKKSIGELAKENPTKTYKELEQMREMAITTINNRTTKIYGSNQRQISKGD